MPSLLRLLRRPAAAAGAAETNRRTEFSTTTATGSSTSLDSDITLHKLLAAARHGAETKQAEDGTARRSGANLMSLPPEIHLLIAGYLIYPDALSLKHANQYFYYLVDTGVELKVEWLMERRMLHLECPNDKRCDLGSDLRFCRGSVALLMKRRREHIECESRPGLGCLIYGTRTCTHSRKLKTRFRRWMRSPAGERATIAVLLLSIIPLAIGWVWLLWKMKSSEP
ncbi:hypothetical protein VTJ83DRAFT_4495 [Remersonia thermophila]|uniref:F-box domain-containing protein n=1 Tax=Remersonia thermophila TaxID=72144 RepID=A0ABR4DA28_9PEZI